MWRRGYSRLQYAIIGCSVAYVLMDVLLPIFKPGPKQLYDAFWAVYGVPAQLFAGVAAVFYACRGKHSSRATRLGWTLIGLSALSFMIGDLVRSHYKAVPGVANPPPSCADIGYLAIYLFLILGITLLLDNMRVVGRARVLLDSAIVASSVGMLSWFYLVQPLWQQSGSPLWGKCLSIAYPLGDVAILFSAIALFKSAGDNQRLRCSFALLAYGIALEAFADILNTYYSLNALYHTGSLTDCARNLGWLCIACAPVALLWWPQKQRDEMQAGLQSVPVVPGLLRTVMPYLAVITAFALVGLRLYAKNGHLSVSVIVAGSSLILLVVMRQVFTLAENQQLNAQLLVLNENLETIVGQRTEQLSALHQLTKAVTNSLKMDEVLSTAAKHTLQVLQTDAVVVWLLGDGMEETGKLPQIHFQQGLEDRLEMLRFIRCLPMIDKGTMVPLPVSQDLEQQSVGVLLRTPLRWQQNAMGMLGVIRWRSSFGQTECELLESIGLEVSTAMENARLYAAAVEAADRDPVTGLYNHRAIHQRLEVLLEEARTANHPLAVIMADIDNFKLFNDTHGHPVGDQILKRIAQVLKEGCREQDVLGRYGSDEFILILPDTDVERAKAVAQRLHSRVMEEGFEQRDEEVTIPIKLSFGIAGCPSDSANRHELLIIADANLYDAKHSESGIVGMSETQRTNRALRAESSFGVLDAMVTAVDNKDRYTRRHSEDVTEYALWVADELGLSEETIRTIRMAGLLHDVGKIGVPDEILRKPGRLTPEEHEVIQRHPRIGELVVRALPGMECIIDGVRSHHERWDSHGYPEGLVGDEIPFAGRLLAVADSFSAMTTDRPYRKGLEWDVALAEIKANIGSQFDPAMAQAFLAAAEKRQPSRVPLRDTSKLAEAA